MYHQFEFLESKEHSLITHSTLSELPCVPVYSTPEKRYKWQVILVKPHCVVSSKHTGLRLFHPFLHLLPSKLMSIEFLAKIGVENEIQMKHMQIVLEAAYNISCGVELDENTKKSVVEAIKYLYKLMKDTDFQSPLQPTMITQGGETSLANALTPLFLPTVEHKLALSTELVYADDPNYRGGVQLNLSETNYQELSIESALYGFSDTSFCSLLPESLKPIGLSQISTIDVNSHCEKTNDSEVALRLKNMLSLQVLRKGCLSAVKGITRQKGIYESLETPIISFMSNVNVITVQRLKAAVVLNDSGREVGESRVSSFLKQNADNQSSILYIDSGLDSHETGDEPLMLLQSHIMLIIEKENIPDAMLREIESLLGLLLKAQSGERVREILDRKGIDLEGVDIDEIEFCIGTEIPQCWRHRLDQSPDNIFHSGEKIGYETSKGLVIFAEILDPILPEGCTDFENVSQIEMKYRIFINEDDEEGLVVSVLSLYKFLRSSPSDDSQREHPSESTDILAYDGETYANKRNLQREDIEDIKRELMEQLDKIWRLPEDEKQRAIKRLYLKWHPDKNPENTDIAEEIFKFLVAEIEHRGNTRLPKAKWDSEAKTHGFYWHWEFSQHTQPRTSGASWWGGGSGTAQSASRAGRRSGGWYGSGGSRHYQPPFDRHDFQIKGNRVEGRRWLKQAVVDAKALQIMVAALSSEPQIACTVCFLAQQLAEKALKAGKFYACGLSDNALKTTKLTSHAYGLQHELRRQPYVCDLPGLAESLDDYSIKTRYPNHCPTPLIPATVVTEEQAREAEHNAQEILKIIQKFVV